MLQCTTMVYRFGHQFQKYVLMGSIPIEFLVKPGSHIDYLNPDVIHTPLG